MTDNDIAQEDILQGDEAIELFKKGKDAWNKKMESNPRRVSFKGVDFSTPELSDLVKGIKFSEFRFPRGVNFEWAEFGKGYVYFIGAEFGNGYVDFRRAKFGKGNVTFRRAKFGDGDVYFIGAEFGKGNVTFSGAEFGKGNVYFSGAEFGKGNVTFSGAEFGKNCEGISFEDIKVEGAFDFRVKPILSKNGVNFNGASFGGVFRLDGVESAGPIDLRATALTHHISLNNTKIKLPREWKIFPFKVATDSAASAKFQRLKELATGASDHERQLDFFAKEMRAARGYETKGLRLILDLLYSGLSNYGNSVLIPILWLILLWFTFSCVYASYAEPVNDGETIETLAKTEQSVGIVKQVKDFVLSDYSIYSLGQMVPLSSSARAASDLGNKENGIFKCDSNSETNRSCAGGKYASVYYWSILQNILAAILLFLLGLGLRNRFRL